MNAHVATLSDSALDVLMPLPQMDAGHLAGFIRALIHAIDGAALGELKNWAWTSLQTFPSIPTKEAVAAQFCDLYDLPAFPWTAS